MLRPRQKQTLRPWAWMALALSGFLLSCATPTPEPTPTATPTPRATPVASRFGDFYLSSPCSVECEMEEYKTKISGSGRVAFKQSPNTQILYSGENGYFIQIYKPATNDNVPYDTLVIFDKAGYMVEYEIPRGASLLGTGPANIRRGQPIAKTRESVTVFKRVYGLDANYGVSLKGFSDKTKGNESSENALQPPFIDLYIDDFRK